MAEEILNDNFLTMNDDFDEYFKYINLIFTDYYEYWNDFHTDTMRFRELPLNCGKTPLCRQEIFCPNLCRKHRKGTSSALICLHRFRP